MGTVRRILMRKINLLLTKGDDGLVTGKGVFYLLGGNLALALGVWHTTKT
jgi:hypothetical protein